MTDVRWPTVEIGNVARLRALAAGLPHVALEEIVIDAPFAAVWGVAGDLEHGVPRFEHDVKRVEVLERRADALRLVATGRFGLHRTFDAVLRPGWCVMSAPGVDIGMAAVAEGEGRTRFAHYEGSRWLGRAGRALFRRWVRRDLERLAAIARSEGGSA